MWVCFFKVNKAIVFCIIHKRIIFQNFCKYLTIILNGTSKFFLVENTRMLHGWEMVTPLLGEQWGSPWWHSLTLKCEKWKKGWVHCAMRWPYSVAHETLRGPSSPHNTDRHPTGGTGTQLFERGSIKLTPNWLVSTWDFPVPRSNKEWCGCQKLCYKLI